MARRTQNAMEGKIICGGPLGALAGREGTPLPQTIFPPRDDVQAVRCDGRKPNEDKKRRVFFFFRHSPSGTSSSPLSVAAMIAVGGKKNLDQAQLDLEV